MPLPPLPTTMLSVVAEVPGADPPGFLRLRRQILQARFPDGTLSESFTYDSVDRALLDAVVVAAHYRDDQGRRHVVLRSALRPSVCLRPRDDRPLPERGPLGALWELPAGLVELDERSEEGLRRCAARELFEETGHRVDASELAPLGPPTFPAPGIIAERQFFFHVEIDPSRRSAPTEDGSVLERHGQVVALPLAEALELVRQGALDDAKTELALRRLAET